MPKINPNDYIGKKYGKLTVQEVFPGNWKTKPQIKATAKCLCECGKEKIIQLGHLKNRKISSCGCIRNSKFTVGDRLNNLIITRVFPHHYENGKRIETKVECKCDCGNIKLCFLHNLRKGNTVSCGCVKNIQKPGLTHGLSNHSLYKLWGNINRRCYTKSSKNFQLWGGRGISNFWKNNPKEFVEYIEKELGPKPTLKHSLDRIDNDGNYKPGNLRWATQKEQCQNKTHAHQRKIEELEQRIHFLENENKQLRMKFDENRIDR